MGLGLALDLEHPEHGYLMSSLGVAELGLNLGFETPATIGLRQLAILHPAFAHDLFGRAAGEGTAVPMIFTFNPERTFIEVVDPDADGYGKMKVSRLDPDRSIPLLRSQTDDVARLLDRDRVSAALRRHGLPALALPTALLVLPGRNEAALAHRAHAGMYEDALSANRDIARHLTGAVRLTFAGNRCTMHVQLVRGQMPEDALEQAILQDLAPEIRPARLVLWPYEAFPYGMGLDCRCEYYTPGDVDASHAAPPPSPPDGH